MSVRGVLLVLLLLPGLLLGPGMRLCVCMGELAGDVECCRVEQATARCCCAAEQSDGPQVGSEADGERCCFELRTPPREGPLAAGPEDSGSRNDRFEPAELAALPRPTWPAPDWTPARPAARSGAPPGPPRVALPLRI